MNTELQKNYGTADWSATGLSYSDEIQITPGDSRTATLSAQYPGSLKDAVADAAGLSVVDVAVFSRTKTADGAETVSMTQSLFHHIYLPFWTPDVAHIQQGWL